MKIASEEFVFESANHLLFLFFSSVVGLMDALLQLSPLFL